MGGRWLSLFGWLRFFKLYFPNWRHEWKVKLEYLPCLRKSVWIIKLMWNLAQRSECAMNIILALHFSWNYLYYFKEYTENKNKGPWKHWQVKITQQVLWRRLWKVKITQQLSVVKEIMATGIVTYTNKSTLILSCRHFYCLRQDNKCHSCNKVYFQFKNRVPV